MKCRHGPGGRHHGVLQGLPAGGLCDSVLNPEHWRRPCVGWGKGDDNKSPGIVVYDLCSKAVQWLNSVGKGVKVRGQLVHSRSISTGSTPDSWPDPEFLDEQRRVLRETLSSPSIPSDELAGLLAEVDPQSQPDPALTDEEFPDMFTPEEYLEMEAEILGNPQETVEVAAQALDTAVQDVGDSGPPDSDGNVPMSDFEFATSSDIGTQLGTRVSTKMRVATLAILQKCSGDPLGAFKDMFNRLRNRDEAVLHLCGCGIKFINLENGEACSGCVEGSHLMLGSSETNQVHLIFHKAMGACDVGDYVAQAQIAHRSQPGCEGIF
ncbi:hypothetical protein LTR10_024362 [Elasticomyces elasticus]|uniref:Uncharacterized protein n=1 Tax=Exophiala sideris TaxID=1016849 RepID=A0ABR0IXT7_9EURO|nr:hypothetical protein LTR10_024362 [Elasticomyces elasticus]KAK5020721.1 hypothetical protein LTS07_011468 [Exophiala sideris]KAK5051638.1 hypothetical protein LTR69_010138 [Exophiala sideris]